MPDRQPTAAELVLVRLERVEANQRKLDTKLDRILKGLGVLVRMAEQLGAKAPPPPKHRTMPASAIKRPAPPAPARPPLPPPAPPGTRRLPEPTPERGDAWEPPDEPGPG